MKKLTDEQVAKALGYVAHPWGGKKWCHYASPHDKPQPRKGQLLHPRHTLPRFTTSLDAIAAEIEAGGGGGLSGL